MRTIKLSDRIREEVVRMIADGELKAGGKLPPERALAARYSASRATVRRALDDLAKAGFVTRLENRGAFASSRVASGTELTPQPGRVELLVPNLNERFYIQLIQGIERTLTDNGMELILFSTDDDPIEERKWLQRAQGRELSGVILIARLYSQENLDVLQALNGSLPLVVVDVEIGGLAADLVVSEDRKGALLVTEHLIELGHTGILHLAGPAGDSSAERRLAGYRDALEKHGIEYRDELVRFTNWTVTDGYCETRKVLIHRASGARPTAVFACNDDVAAGAYRAIADSGLRVPDDVALAGYGDYPGDSAGFMCGIALTSVDQSAPGMGSAAAQLILGKCLGRRALLESRTLAVETTLVVRQSCGILIPACTTTREGG